MHLACDLLLLSLSMSLKEKKTKQNISLSPADWEASKPVESLAKGICYSLSNSSSFCDLWFSLPWKVHLRTALLRELVWKVRGDRGGGCPPKGTELCAECVLGCVFDRSFLTGVSRNFWWYDICTRRKMSTDSGMLSTSFLPPFWPAEASPGPYLGCSAYKHQNVNLFLKVPLEHFHSAPFLLISTQKERIKEIPAADLGIVLG